MTTSPAFCRLADVAIRVIPVGRVVVLRDLPQPHPAAVVHHDVADGAGLVVGRDRPRGLHEVGLDDLDVVLARVGVALGGALVVVERHAGRDDVDEREPAVREAGLQDRHELRLVAREAAGDERRAEREREQAAVDGVHRVRLAPLAQRPEIGRRRELPLGQAVDAVVLEHVEHVHVAANRVTELAEADRQRIAVARDADVDQVAVGGVGAGHERRHAPVDAVEPVRLAQEVGRRLRRAADAGQLGHLVRRDRRAPRTPG